MKFKQNITQIMKNRKRGRKLLSERKVLLVQKLYSAGQSMRECAARAGIALGSVHKILSGNHPNQKTTLAEIKKEYSRNLYKYLRRKRHAICASLPPISEISWLRIKGKKLIIETVVVIAENVNGVLMPMECMSREKIA